jgi:hypothetical protein
MALNTSIGPTWAEPGTPLTPPTTAVYTANDSRVNDQPESDIPGTPWAPHG